MSDQPPAISKPLTGKGLYVWKLSQVLDPQGQPFNWDWLAAELTGHGFGHLCVKGLDGATYYNQRLKTDPVTGATRWVDDLLPALVPKLQAAGIVVYLWQYLYRAVSPETQALAAVQRCRNLGADGLVLDVESHMQGCGSNWVNAYFSALRNGGGRPRVAGLGNGFAVGLSSYRYPSLHPGIPYQAFMDVAYGMENVGKCQFLAPQVYWEGSHNPAAQLRRCVQEYLDLGWTDPDGSPSAVWPVGAAYPRGSWAPTPEDLAEFAAAAAEIPARAVSFYRWGTGGLDDLPALKAALWALKYGAAPPGGQEPPPPPGTDDLAALHRRLDRLETWAASYHE